MPALGVLAAASYARRQRATKNWLFVGILIPIAFLTAVEFSFYSVLAVIGAIAVSDGRRFRNLVSFAAGAGVACVPFVALFGALGILKPFFESSFGLLPHLAPVYSLGFPALPPELESGLLPEVL